MRRIAVLCTSLLLASSCETGTDPGPRLEVVLSADAPRPAILPQADGSHQIVCDFSLLATATGSSGATGAWESAIFRFRFGPEGAPASDSVLVSADELRQVWAPELISTGGTQRSSWRFWGTAPFQLDAEFRYRLDGNGRARSTAVDVPCGPVGAAVNGPPVLSHLTVSQAGASLEPGDSLEVSYTAVGASPLWKSTVTVTGAFASEVEVSEEFRTTSTRTVWVRVPPDARLGDSARVSVRVEDVALRSDTVAPVMGVEIVDLTAPALREVAVPSPRPHLAGRFAPGDTMTFVVGAEDNHRLRWIVYELGEPVNHRDSVAVSDQRMFDRPVAVPVRPEWLGTPELRVYVRDVAGHRSEIVTSLPDSILFYPEVEVTARSATITGGYRGVIPDPSRGLLYLVNPDSAVLKVFSTQAMVVLRSVALPAGATSGDLSVSGDSLLLALPTAGALAVLDLLQPEAPPVLVPLTVASAAGLQPHDLRVAADGRVLAAVGDPARTRADLLEWHPSTGEQVLRADAHRARVSGYPLYALGRAGDRSSLLSYFDGAHCLQRFDVAADRMSACREIQFPGDLWTGRLGLIEGDGTGSRYLVAAGVYDSELALVRLLPFAFDPLPLVATMDPGGGSVYVATSAGVVRVRTDDGRYLERYRLPAGAMNTWNRLLYLPGEAALVLVERFATGYPEQTRIRVFPLP